MDLEERTLDDTIARTCAVCGAHLTSQEIQDAREEGGPFLCTVHAMEEVPSDAGIALMPAAFRTHVSLNRPEKAPAKR